MSLLGMSLLVKSLLVMSLLAIELTRHELSFYGRFRHELTRQICATLIEYLVRETEKHREIKCKLMAAFKAES